MRTHFHIALVAATVVASSGALAHPENNVPCSSCHAPVTDRLTLSGNDTTVALSDRLDGVPAGALKVFTLNAGDTVDLVVNVTQGETLFDPFFYNFDYPGLQNSLSNKLTFAADPAWTGNFSDRPLPYFTYSPQGILWSGSPTSYTYHLAVDPQTPADYYSLVLGVSGLGISFQRWTQEEEVYLHVIPEPSMAVILSIGLVAVVVFAGRKRSTAQQATHCSGHSSRRMASVGVLPV